MADTGEFSAVPVPVPETGAGLEVSGSGGGGQAQDGMVEVAKSRVAQEVQAAMVVARRFPRDQAAAYARIMESCRRRGLAEQAMYSYPRGGTTVIGPSVRLAEALAQGWGNLDFGIVEVEQRPGESTVMAYAWDLESNVRQTKIFHVPHVRWTKRAGAVRLRDPRDIYEMTANQGARRLRACILGVIPGDVIEAAVERCRRTLTEGHDTPLVDRVREMVTAFRELGVSVEMIQTRLGHKIDTTTEHELVALRGIYRAIKDNMQPAHAYFEAPGSGDDGSGGSTVDKVKDAVRSRVAAQRGESARASESPAGPESIPEPAQAEPDGWGEASPGSVTRSPESRAAEASGHGPATARPKAGEPGSRGSRYISEPKRKRLWAIAHARAEALGHGGDRGVAEGIVRYVLDQHGIEADPERPGDGPSTRRIEWRGKVYDSICADIEGFEFSDSGDGSA